MNLFTAGLRAFTRNSKLWFVLVLIIVLPGVFLFSFSSIQSATDANIRSTQTQRMSSFQDLLTVLLLQNNLSSDAFIQISSSATDLVRLVVLVQRGEEFVTVFNTDTDKIGSIETRVDGFRAATVRPGESIIFEVNSPGLKSWQAYRYISQGNFYLLSEHRFTSFESLMQSRWIGAYLTLSLVFLFIIALAYWLMRQIDFERQNKLLKQKMRERDLIAEGMVHELRAPLTAMRGYASLIEESPSVSLTEREYAKRIGESAARLVDLVSDFLRAAKVHSNDLLVNHNACDIASLLNKSIDQFKAQATAKGLVLNTPDTSSISEPVFTDEKRLEQILINLISNAIKYTDSGSISLTVEQTFRSTTFTVADTGAGMSAEDQKKLFAPFVRVGDSATQSKVTGTGLGMWLTKEMVEQLNGTIGVESIKGLGTHVVVTIPNRLTTKASENNINQV